MLDERRLQSMRQPPLGHLLVLLCFVSILAGGCSPVRQATDSQSTRMCLVADSPLAQLVQADDPAAFAAVHGQEYKDGFVSVQFRVVGGVDLSRYSLADVAQYRDLVEARVPLNRLCDLADADGVSRVMHLQRAISDVPAQ
jgi:hypothetical protein